MAKSLYPEYTPEEIDRIVRETAEYNQGGLAASRPPFCDRLAGRRFTLRYDGGAAHEYDFADAHRLQWRDCAGGAGGASSASGAGGANSADVAGGTGNAGAAEGTGGAGGAGGASGTGSASGAGGELHSEYYEALEADDGVILLVHTLSGTSPQEARMVTLELGTGLATAFFARIGNEVSAREVDRDIAFGYIDDGSGAPAPEARHGLTTELVGRSIVWTYSPQFSIQHIYASKWYSAFVDFNTFYGGMLLSSPCNYVKISDHVYIYSWVETEGAGVQGFALMNLHSMHDVGCFFGINGSGKFECYTFGAVGEYVGQLANFDLPNDQRADYPWPPARGETA
ncbi:MAG: molybdenum cofactor biosynthesis F family protein [Clostridiales bacterium]|nr:molybdenum cofactor biosynthesis F family protein [Clostridiales bacterium]